MSLSYQGIEITQHTDDFGNSMNIGKIDDNALDLGLDYAFADKWAISVGLPYKDNKFSGVPSHDPTTLPPDFQRGQRLIDDGRYRHGWGDWAFSLRYQWITAPILVTPFIGYASPSHGYDFFAESAFGTRQHALQMGVYLGDRFPRPWQNLYWDAAAYYSLMQPKDGRRVNHADASVELGYAFTPTWRAHVQLEHEWTFNGITDLQFVNPDGTPNFGYILYHDSLLAVRYTKLDIGVGYQLNDNYSLSADYGTSLSGAEVHLIKYAVSLGITRSF